eukprot:768754-Hanusia_phi.AAC.1
MTCERAFVHGDSILTSRDDKRCGGAQTTVRLGDGRVETGREGWGTRRRRRGDEQVRERGRSKRVGWFNAIMKAMSRRCARNA